MTSPKGILWILGLWLTAVMRVFHIVPAPVSTDVTTTTVVEAVPETVPETIPVTTIPVTTIGTTVPRITTPTISTAKVSITNDIWWELALCECGGNAGCNTGNGYYGAFQFSLDTWSSVGGIGLPSEASYETQKSYAKILQARSGFGQWPSCSKQLGLR